MTGSPRFRPAIALTTCALVVVCGGACAGTEQILGVAPGGDGGLAGFGDASNCSSGPDFAGCPCQVGQVVACYTGPPSTRGLGLCRDGAQTCLSSGELASTFGPCLGETVPSVGSSCDHCGGPATAPRLIAPLSTAHATHQQPALKWELTGPDDGVHIEFCKDRACTEVLQALDTTGTSGAPTANLPAGVVYWRAFGTSGGQIGCNPSYVWEFFVGPRSAPVNTSWGSVLDVNGDGYADAVVGSSGSYTQGTPYNNGETEQATVFLGSANGLSPSPVVTLTGERGFGGAIADAGDVNGDGYADVLVATQMNVTHLFLGGPSGLTATSTSLPFGGTNVTTFWVYTLAGVGDSNGDGYADIARWPIQRQHHVYVINGGPGALSASPASTFSGASVWLNVGFSSTIAGAGDVNGDGFGDLLIGATPSGDPSSLPLRQAYLYQGGPTGLGTAPASTPTVPESGGSVMGAGDVNGDGYCDVLMQGQPAGTTTAMTSTAFVAQGEAAPGFPSTPATALTLSSTMNNWYGNGKAGVDLNGDGYSDVVVGAPWINTFYIYMGGPSGASSTPLAPVSSGNAGYFAGGLSGADVNGDGFGDLAVANLGDLRVYSGSAAGLVTSSQVTVSTSGGYSAFHAALGSP